MLARFMFSITVPKYGEERWIFSQNNQCENGKNFGEGDLCTFLYLYIHTFYIQHWWRNHRFRNINVDNFKRCDTDVVLHSHLHHIDICKESLALHERLRIALVFTHFVWGILTNFYLTFQRSSGRNHSGNRGQYIYIIV